jgi:hypothetical protein
MSPPPADDERDGRLLARIQGGDGRALSDLYDVWGHTVYSIGVHLLGDPAAAEEAVEGTFSQIWSEASQYSSAQGSVSAWIVVVARSQSLARFAPSPPGAGAGEKEPRARRSAMPPRPRERSSRTR